MEANRFFVEKPTESSEPEPVIPVSEKTKVDPELATGFTSSKYREIVAETVPSKPEPAPVEKLPTPTSEDLNYDAITACPSCGEVINVDTFEYPREIYSAMGAARMKEARYFVVQGKYKEAQKIVRVARSLYMKAGDDGGIAEVTKLVDSLARRG